MKGPGRPKKKKADLKTPWAGRFNKDQRQKLKSINKKSIQKGIDTLIEFYWDHSDIFEQWEQDNRKGC